MIGRSFGPLGLGLKVLKFRFRELGVWGARVLGSLGSLGSRMREHPKQGAQATDTVGALIVRIGFWGLLIKIMVSYNESYIYIYPKPYSNYGSIAGHGSEEYL